MATLSFVGHCIVGLSIRFILIIYADFHERIFSVPYTDVDYKVYTDAARFLLEGYSPFRRHTYRYTPLLALILTPNILVHADFGKVIFSVVDIVVTVLIKNILLRENNSKRTAEAYALVWLYNPLTFVISTRGNADSLSVLFVLSTLYFFQRDKTIISGLMHGLSIHFRLYPIAFSLSMYLALRDKHYFLPSLNQLKLLFSCLLSLTCFTAISYYFYGYEYLYESLIYHLIRKDARHNFSLFFYMTYLSTGQSPNILNRLFTFLPQLIVLVALSLRYSSKKEVPFAMLTLAIVMVTYNSVMTSQYFFWFLSLLPLCLPNIRMALKRWLILLAFWVLSQGLWLFDAYLLEFKAVNSFYRIWLDAIIFFVVNIKILQDIVRHYDSAITTAVDSR